LPASRILIFILNSFARNGGEREGGNSRDAERTAILGVLGEVMGNAVWRERCTNVGLDGRCEEPDIVFMFL